jgi:hypothetical protein
MRRDATPGTHLEASIDLEQLPIQVISISRFHSWPCHASQPYVSRPQLRCLLTAMANWSEAFRQCVFILPNSLDDLLATNLAPSALETPPIASTMILRLLLNSYRTMAVFASRCEAARLLDVTLYFFQPLIRVSRTALV